MILIVTALAIGASDVTFVRHAETVANATGKYNSKTLNAISDKGKTQITELTAQLLKQAPYDVILVSPSPRAMLTIAPYLQASHQTATVWPLLYECCTGRKKASAPTKFSWGPKFSVPDNLRGLIRIDPKMDRLPNAPDYAAGLAQVDASVAEFRAKWMGKRVLLVGHSGHGGQFIHALTGKWKKVDNATPMSIPLPPR